MTAEDSKTIAMPRLGRTEELTRDECVAKLSRHPLGRIAITHGGLPQILPVNYRFDGTSLVFRTNEGGLLDRSCHSTVVAFEIDGYDLDSGGGWSVLVVGTATVLGARDSLRAVEMQLRSVGASEGQVFVKIVPGVITGRRFGKDR